MTSADPAARAALPYTTLFRSGWRNRNELGPISRDPVAALAAHAQSTPARRRLQRGAGGDRRRLSGAAGVRRHRGRNLAGRIDRKSTRLNSSHVEISYAVFGLK